ncbi:hypothetical protein OPV22_018307 [Ensete ventricosum]|uniref:Senescence domain-containing protein n=1 Tax=Ensete ventricosum TaxID=4639 RepID=A0AAV8QTZ4_ENSVE|nr:hypothetical protein OPV22_018307 [Ensete ventricosum]
MDKAASVQGRCRERGLVRTAWPGGRPSGSMARSTSALGVELPEKAARPLSRSFASSAVHVSTRHLQKFEVVKNATKGITDLEIADSDSETTEEGLDVLDNSVETFASGARSALGSAWKEGSSLVSKLELSAVSLADSIQQGNLPGKVTSFAPSIIETGKTFTTKGMEVLEWVGKETMDLLIAETGLQFEKSHNEVHQEDDEEQLEEVTLAGAFIFIDVLICLRNWKHCQAIMLCCLTGEKQNF